MESHQARIWKCGNCPAAYVWKSSLTKHKKYCQKNIEFRCDQCLDTFKTEKTLANHKKYQICLKKKYRRHGVPFSQSEMFKCDTCSASFTRPEGLTEHKKHNVCQRVKSKNEFKGNRIPEVKNFQCDQCPANFYWKNALTKHQRMNIHGQKVTSKQKCPNFVPELNKYYCKKCETSYVQKSAFNRHYRNRACLRKIALKEKLRKPAQPTNYKCNECGSSYTRKYGLTRHLIETKCGENLPEKDENGKLNAKPQKFQCEYCDVTSSRLAYIKKHQRFICKRRKAAPAPQRLKCTLCKHTFSRIEVLQYHMHHKICQRNKDIAEQQKKFQCKKCCSRFHVLLSSRIHARSSVCETFSLQSKDNSLVNQNSSKKDTVKQQNQKTLKVQFPCRWCYGLLSSQGEMISHMKQVHKKDIPTDKLADLDKETLKIDVDRPKNKCCYVCLKRFHCVFANYICLEVCEDRIGLLLEGYKHPNRR